MSAGRPAADQPQAETRRCPSCDAPVADDVPTLPFCSSRCRWVDLGRWFNEEYSVPGEAAIDMHGFDDLGDVRPPDGEG